MENASSKNPLWAKVLFFTLLTIVVSGIGIFTYAWYATAPAQAAYKEATLHIEKGTVFIKENNKEFQAVQGEKLKEGMVVRTEKDTDAALVFFDNSIARLAAETEVAITDLEHNPEKPTQDKVGLELLVGRVWSRVQSLLNVQAKFEVKTSTTVATVRGTAFDVVRTKDGWTHIGGAHGVIDCETTDGWKAKVTKGKWANIPDDKKKAAQDKKLNQALKADQKAMMQKDGGFWGELPAVTDEDWWQGNVKDDEVFDAALTRARAQERDRLAAPLNNAFLAPVARFAAQTRIALADPEEREDYAADWVRREMSLAQSWADEGRVNDALQAMQGVKEQWNEWDLGDMEEVQEVYAQSLLRSGSLAQTAGQELYDYLPDMWAQTPEQNAWLKTVLLEEQMEGATSKEDMEFYLNQLNQLDLPLEMLQTRKEYLQQEYVDFSGFTDFQGDDGEQVSPEELKEIQDALHNFQVNPQQNTVIDPKDYDAADLEALKEAEAWLKEQGIQMDTTTLDTSTQDVSAPTSFAPTLHIYGETSVFAGEGVMLEAAYESAPGVYAPVTSAVRWSVSGAAGGTVQNGYFQAGELAGTVTVTAEYASPSGTLRAVTNVVVEPHLDLGNMSIDGSYGF